jgi:hypothetical protein
MKKLTKEQRNKLHAVATDLMAIWDELPIPDCEEGMDWGYRGGLVQLTAKGGYTSGWVDLSWNDVIADIYAGQKLSGSYEKLVEEASIAQEEKNKTRGTPSPIMDVEEL